MKNHFKDFPKVEGKEAPKDSANRWDVKLLDGKMIAELYQDGKMMFWAIIDHPENFCDVVDAYRALQKKGDSNV